MAPPIDPPTTITLRIKVPPGHIPGGADEFTLGSDIAVSLRVGQIRERIQETVPSSPTPERQRLLYGGRALIDNDQTLADALNIRRDPSQNEYVVHLLVKGDGANTAPTPHRQGMATPGRAHSPGVPPPQPTTQQMPPPQQHPFQQPQPVHHHHHMSPQMLAQHQAALAQQQRLHAQMLQNANLNRMQQPALAGITPFGLQQMNIPGMHFPQQHIHPGFPAGMPAQHQPPQPGATHTADGTPVQPSEQAQQQGHPTNGQAQPHPTGAPNDPQAQLPQPPRRPLSNQGFHMEGIGPNGERFSVHQQTVNFQHNFPGALPGQHMHLPQGVPIMGMPHFALPQGLPQLPLQPPQRSSNTPSALEQARQNVAEMRQMLEEMRNEDTAGANADRIRRLEERTGNINDYIDPLRLGNTPSRTPRTGTPSQMGGWQQRAQQIRQAQRSPQPNGQTTSSDVTCYLLSSPTGPQAILYSPQHGAFTGHLPHQNQQTSTNSLQPTATTDNNTALAQRPGQQNQAVAAPDGAQANGAQQAQAQAPQQDPLGPMGPILGHFWLLFRILIFSYFLLGANMGWRRPLALLAIGVGFWMMRVGLLAEGAAIRRWWDGIMNDHPQGARAPNNQQAGPPGAGQHQGQNQAQGQAEGQGQDQGNGNGNQQQPAARRGQMPTPEQFAQRLLDEDRRARDNRLQWWRERIRPVERAAALLFASLWPGVGEAYVRAREQEERRRAEEEVAARRREEEEKQRKEEEEKNKEGASATTESGPSAEANSEKKPEVAEASKTVET